LMSLEVGLRYPRRLGGVVGVSGYVADPANLARSLSPVAKEQRLLVTHGILDPIIPVAFAREQIRFLQTQGLQIQWQEFMKPHVFGGEEELALIRNFIRES
jgi:phospholipase/carboxylesterase